MGYCYQCGKECNREKSIADNSSYLSCYCQDCMRIALR